MTTHTQRVERNLIVRPSKEQGRAYRESLRHLPGERLWELYDQEAADLSRCWFVDMVRQELVERHQSAFNHRAKGHRFGRRHQPSLRHVAAWEV